MNKLLYFDDKIIAKTITDIGYCHNAQRCYLKYGPLEHSACWSQVYLSLEISTAE